MLTFLQKAYDDNTPHDYSMSGVQLGAARTLILAKIIAHNQTVKTLHLSRKEINDKEGQDLASMLLTNKTLRKLELEGNCLGLQTAKKFAYVLRHNTTLKSLDLESNNLTHDGEENGGVEEMISALMQNKSLLSLNLGNNKLDENIGRMFVDCLHQNKTLIDFEFSNNFFRLEDVSYSFSRTAAALPLNLFEFSSRFESFKTCSAGIRRSMTVIVSRNGWSVSRCAAKTMLCNGYTWSERHVMSSYAWKKRQRTTNRGRLTRCGKPCSLRKLRRRGAPYSNLWRPPL